MAISRELRNGKDGQSLWGWILLTVLSISCLGMGSHRGDTGNVLTIEALYKHCGLPVDCGASANWDGETVTISGRVDPDNIFNRKRTPRLPYEKFRLIDDEGRSVEVWPKSEDNSAIFNKLSSHPSGKVTVTGIIEAVKLPISNKCRLGIKVVINHADQIEFK